ncbi:DUF5050 domain-containing protein [Paenibacillus xanthanilyticus]|uniref:DUF5050 domain-containing protein n=1 Tax=Paenibacillus xanthanilyticus TaxID=1783531 RepID=A0ABV8K874_9BACL
MYGNRQNGGLIASAGDERIVGDVGRHSGTYIIEGPGDAPRQLREGVFWFMQAGGPGRLLYSDQHRGSRLYRMELAERREQLVLDRPCYMPLLAEDGIYYIDEEDQGLYRCDRDGRETEPLVREQVQGFFLEEDAVWYAAAKGIKRCARDGSGAELIAQAAAAFLLPVGDYLAFADTDNGSRLALLERRNGEVHAERAIAAASLNTDGRYLYCANALGGHHIYRYDPVLGSSFRMSGERADYLHILDRDLYYMHGGAWRRLSLDGGEPVQITL